MWQNEHRKIVRVNKRRESFLSIAWPLEELLIMEQKITKRAESLLKPFLCFTGLRRAKFQLLLQVSKKKKNGFLLPSAAGRTSCRDH